MMSAIVIKKAKQQLAEHYFKIINFVIFQSVWMLCVIGQHQYIYLAIILVALHFLLSPSPRIDAKVVAAVATLGITLDYLLMLVAVFEFPHHSFPAWLCVVWLAFALTLNHSMAWLAQCSLVVQVILGAIGGASSYIGGHFLGAVYFTYSLTLSAVILILVWAVAMPLYCRLHKAFGNTNHHAPS